MKAEDAMIQATGPSVLTQPGTRLDSEGPRRPTEESDVAIALCGGDCVELSHVAESQMEGEPFRAELVQRVRAEIADGTYLTDEKLDAVVERLHRELFR